MRLELGQEEWHKVASKTASKEDLLYLVIRDHVGVTNVKEQ